MTKRVRTREQLNAMLLAQQKRRAANPEKYREMGRKSEHRRRLKRYGVTEEWYVETIKAQKNSCAICLIALTPGRWTHIDHDHRTNKPRGILCHSCNLLLGHCKDDQLVLQQAINYLLYHS